MLSEVGVHLDYTPAPNPAGRMVGMSDRRILLTFGFLLLAGLWLTISGIAGQMTGESALSSSVAEELQLQLNPDQFVVLGNMLAWNNRWRAFLMTVNGVVVTLAAAYGLFVTSRTRLRMTPAPAPKRRWLSWSLRTFFVAVTIVGISLGWQLNLVRQRSDTLRWIVGNGGLTVSVDEAVQHKMVSSRPNATLPFFRKWLGDQEVFNIAIEDESDPNLIWFSLTERQFPEANVYLIQNRAQLRRAAEH